MIPELSTLIALANGNVRLLSLLFGVGSFILGVSSIFAHRRELDRGTAQAETARNERFEVRKFRRRSLNGSLIASMGVIMSGLYWVTEPRLFSLFLLMILALLSGILVIAMFDMFSVGMHSLTDTRATDHKTLLNEYQRRKQEHENQPLGPGEE